MDDAGIHLSQDEIDEKALSLIEEIFQLGRSGKQYRHLLVITKHWVQMSPKAQAIIKSIKTD